MDVNAIKHEDMLEVSLIEGEAKIENGYYTQEPSNEDSTATINHGLKLRNLHDITSRFEFIETFCFRISIERKGQFGKKCMYAALILFLLFYFNHGESRQILGIF